MTFSPADVVDIVASIKLDLMELQKMRKDENNNDDMQLNGFTLKLVKLKAFVRLLTHNTREARDQAQNSKANNEVRKNKLKSILAEKALKEKELKGVLEFKSVYPQIELYDLEVYHEKKGIVCTSEVADEHELMLNRLNFELEERQRYYRSLAYFVGFKG
jgi:THO complex subunit 5